MKWKKCRGILSQNAFGQLSCCFVHIACLDITKNHRDEETKKKKKKTVKNPGRGDDHGNQEGYNVMIL